MANDVQYTPVLMMAEPSTSLTSGEFPVLVPGTPVISLNGLLMLLVEFATSIINMGSVRAVPTENNMRYVAVTGAPAI
jgi:hypothetical protein